MLKNINSDQLVNLAFLGNCVKGIAHNVNTPLSAVLGRAEMLQIRLNKIKNRSAAGSEADELEKCLKDISLIIDNSNKISDTIKNAMKKSINGESDKIQSIRLDYLIRDELEFLNADMYFKHNVQKTFNIDDNIPPIKGVYVHFSNSFLELIENSKQSMIDAKDKKLIIALTKKDSQIELSITDTGCGIDNEKKEHLLQLLHNQTLENAVMNSRESGIQKIGRLLKIYEPAYDIQSTSGVTTFAVRFSVQHMAY